MRHHHPLDQIRSRTRTYWDRDETRSAVREAFRRADQCRTAELGAEVYCSENQELILYHTCKSRACPSCGHRANVQWLRERWAASLLRWPRVVRHLVLTPARGDGKHVEGAAAADRIHEEAQRGLADVRASRDAGQIEL